MEPIELEEADKFDIARYQNWLEEGASSGLLLGSSVDHVKGGTPSAWLAKIDGVIVATVTIVQEDQHSYISLGVDPSKRRQGIGSRTLSQLLLESSVMQIRSLHARVSTSNTGAQKMLIKNGFSKLGYTQEGRLDFEYRP